MKTYSDERPRSLMPLGDGNYHYHYNITETEAPAMEAGGELRTQYESDTVFVSGEPTVGKIVSAVVHESYHDEDIALMNAQHQAAEMGLDDEPEGYQEYLILVANTRSQSAAAIAEHEDQTSSERAGAEQETETEESSGEEVSAETSESISEEEVGSVEEVLGDLLNE